MAKETERRREEGQEGQERKSEEEARHSKFSLLPAYLWRRPLRGGVEVEILGRRQESLTEKRCLGLEQASLGALKGTSFTRLGERREAEQQDSHQAGQHMADLFFKVLGSELQRSIWQARGAEPTFSCCFQIYAKLAALRLHVA